LSIVRIFLNTNEKTQRFGNWICFRPQVREDTYSVGSLERANLNHWPSSPEDGNRSSFLNVVFFYWYLEKSGRWTKSENTIFLCDIQVDSKLLSECRWPINKTVYGIKM
jgi:hypothetical protein